MIDILSQVGIPVIPVNVQGVMGAGLALQARNRVPWIARGYHWALEQRRLALGQPVFIPAPIIQERVAPHLRGAVLFATKDRWQEPSREVWVECGLRRLRHLIDTTPPLATNIIWVPPLGCGLGGLNERVVYGLVHQHLGDLPLVRYVGTDGAVWDDGHNMARDYGGL